MGELPTNFNPEWDPEKTEPHSLKTDLLITAGLGTSVGVASDEAYRLIGQDSLADQSAVGYGIAIMATGLGFSLSRQSVERAEEHARKGNKKRAYWKLRQARFESAIGTGIGAAIAGYEFVGLKEGIACGLIGSIMGGSFSRNADLNRIKLALKSSSSQESRAKPNCRVHYLPNEPLKIFKFLKYPPVFTALTLRDMQMFREYHKPTILKTDLIKKQQQDPVSTGAEKTAAIFILPPLEHSPRLDPQQSKENGNNDRTENYNSMLLTDMSGNKIIVYSLKTSSQFWSHSTTFVPSRDTKFDQNRWDYWQQHSWTNSAVVMAQYQHSQTDNKSTSPTPDTVVDKYWLVDIVSDNQRGKPEEMKRKLRIKQAIPVFNPGNI